MTHLIVIMSKEIKNLRIFLYLVLVCVVVFLFYKAIVPFGQISYVRDFASESRFIDIIKPLERTQPVIDGTQTITGGPVYFNLKAPRNFDTAKVTFKYRLSPVWVHQIIEAGVLVDAARSQYLLKPLENSIIDKQISDWSQVTSDTITLYQRQATYASVESFLKNLPDINQLATYNYDLKRDFRLPAYKPGRGVTIDWLLKGNYSFYTYAKDEKMKISFDFKELDGVANTAKASLALYEDGKMVKLEDLTMEHLLTSSYDWSHVLEYDAQGEHLYKVELKLDNTTGTKSISSSQDKLAFVGRVPFAFDYGRKFKLYTDSREVNLLAINSASLGMVKVGSTSLEMTDAYKQYSVRTDSSLCEVVLPKSGLDLSGDGIFAPTRAAAFNPKLKTLNYLTDFEKEGVDYILTKYESPKTIDGWHEAIAEFDLRGATKDKGDYKFMLSIPGFKNGERSTDWLEIKEIKVDLAGQNLWQMIKNGVRRRIKALI